MLVDGHGHAEDWLRAERVTSGVVKVYKTVFGSVLPLFENQGFDEEQPLSTLAVADLARLTSRAIGDLAARDAMMAGRRPLARCDWRVILYSLYGSRTLREAIGRCAECFEAIDWRCGRMTLRLRGDRAELELMAIRPSGLSDAGCLVDLFGLTEIHGLLSWLIGRTIRVNHAWLDHDPDLFAALELPTLPFALRLAQGWTGFDFGAVLLDYPVVRTADELDLQPLSNMLFFGGVHEPHEENAADRVRRIAFASLRDTYTLPAFEEVVTAMGTSEATLRRRLVREGTSYRQIRESCRRELGLNLLRRTRIPIEEIALRLDYCDSDAFRQAFRIWAGQSPSSYRGECAV